MKTKKNKIHYRTWDEVAVEHFKKEPKLADDFLKLALKEYQKDNDEKALLIALRQVALAKGGFSLLSEKTGLSRESLYKTLSSKGNPTFNTLKIILQVLGYKLTFKAV